MRERVKRFWTIAAETVVEMEGVSKEAAQRKCEEVTVGEREVGEDDAAILKDLRRKWRQEWERAEREVAAEAEGQARAARSLCIARRRRAKEFIERKRRQLMVEFCIDLRSATEWEIFKLSTDGDCLEFRDHMAADGNAYDALLAARAHASAVGVDRYSQRKKYASEFQMLRHFEVAARGEDPEALCGVGMCYENGYGARADHGRAFRMYTAAARMGSAHGEFCVGRAMMEGTGVEKNVAEGCANVRRAAEKGNADGPCAAPPLPSPSSPPSAAQFYISNCYRRGMGVERDAEAAERWLVAAATLAHPAALSHIQGLAIHERAMGNLDDLIRSLGEEEGEKGAGAGAAAAAAR